MNTSEEAEAAMDRRKPIAVLVVVTLLGMVFAGSFLGSLHRPEPHGVPVAVVGPAETANRIGTALDRRAEGAFDLEPYATEQDARKALMDREVDAVFVPGQGGARLIVAGATGRVASGVVAQVFQGVGQATGQPVTVQDAVPLPADDGNGISAMFFVVTLVIPGVAMAVMLALALPAAGAAERAGLLAAGSIALSGANTWIAAGLTGALAGAPWALWGLGALLVFAVASVTAGALRTVGPPAAGLAVLLFVPVGVPASGGPIGSRFIPEWYAAFGEVLPVAAGMDAVRNTVYFDGGALGGPLLVLSLWAAAGLALVLAPRVRRHGAARAMEPVAGHGA
jgi:hypothetical protein